MAKQLQESAYASIFHSSHTHPSVPNLYQVVVVVLNEEVAVQGIRRLGIQSTHAVTYAASKTLVSDGAHCPYELGTSEPVLQLWKHIFDFFGDSMVHA